jgi:hypothetical protein
MAGLDPVIYAPLTDGADHRVKPGDDESVYEKGIVINLKAIQRLRMRRFVRERRRFANECNERPWLR